MRNGINMPDNIYGQGDFIVSSAGNVCISMAGILPSWDDFIPLPEQEFSIGRFLTVKAVQMADYLLVAPLPAIAELIISVAVKYKRRVERNPASIRGKIRLIRPILGKWLAMRL